MFFFTIFDCKTDRHRWKHNLLGSLIM